MNSVVWLFTNNTLDSGTPLKSYDTTHSILKCNVHCCYITDSLLSQDILAEDVYTE